MLPGKPEKSCEDGVAIGVTTCSPQMLPEVPPVDRVIREVEEFRPLLTVLGEEGQLGGSVHLWVRGLGVAAGCVALIVEGKDAA